MPYTETPWGSGYPWYEVVSDLTSINKEYHFKNLPKNWQDEWPKYVREYGWLPVDPKGEYWQIPENPIVMAPLVKSVFTEGAIEGTGTTALIEAGSPIVDVTFTEVGETATATVTTAGAVSATSSAVATAAVGAAIGFGVGIGSFELAPEFWTKVSNTVFGTDLNPDEIGQMTRDTNALVVIKDGLVYMAQDMIEAIRNAFFDIGAADENVTYPDKPTTSTIELASYDGTLRDFLNNCDPNILSLAMWSNEVAAQMLDMNGIITGYFTHTPLKDRYWGKFMVWNGEATIPQTCPVHNNEATIEVKKTYLYTLEFDTLDSKHPIPTVSAFFQSVFASVWIGKTIRGNNTQYQFGNVNTKTKGKVDGLTPDGTQGAKDQPLTVLFPDWVSKGIETIAGDGKSKIKWLPVSIPNSDPLINGNPFTGDQAREGTFPEDYTENATKLGEQIQEKTKEFPAAPTPPIPSIPDITPTPDDPSLIGGGGSLTGLANLYNPTLAQVKQFSRWLWGSDGLNLDQLKKLLQDPMQAIIGLHVMYATPTTGANRDIQVGYINSGVPSKIVTEQYTEIDCGTVTINEYFGDARDYSPYTQVYCYLPFIGIVELNADDVVNSKLGINYKIDVLTGCCLAQLTVKKYGLDAVLYTYTGNCAVQMPITSGNYLSTVSSLLGAVVSGAAAVATGGALAPVAIGAAANAMGGGARSSVAMSGSLGSNAGAMGIRKPYLIIKRVESADANGYNEFYGYPTNKRVNLSQLTGYVRVKEINLSGTNATEDEQNEIVALLKEGVIL